MPVCQLSLLFLLRYINTFEAERYFEEKEVSKEGKKKKKIIY